MRQGLRRIGKMLSLALFLALVLTGVACNTMEGAGKDIEKGGEKIQDAAD